MTTLPIILTQPRALNPNAFVLIQTDNVLIYPDLQPSQLTPILGPLFSFQKGQFTVQVDSQVCISTFDTQVQFHSEFPQIKQLLKFQPIKYDRFRVKFAGQSGFISFQSDGVTLADTFLSFGSIYELQLANNSLKLKLINIESVRSAPETSAFSQFKLKVKRTRFVKEVEAEFADTFEATCFYKLLKSLVLEFCLSNPNQLSLIKKVNLVRAHTDAEEFEFGFKEPEIEEAKIAFEPLKIQPLNQEPAVEEPKRSKSKRKKPTAEQLAAAEKLKQSQEFYNPLAQAKKELMDDLNSQLKELNEPASKQDALEYLLNQEIPCLFFAETLYFDCMVKFTYENEELVLEQIETSQISKKQSFFQKQAGNRKKEPFEPKYWNQFPVHKMLTRNFSEAALEAFFQGNFQLIEFEEIEELCRFVQQAAEQSGGVIQADDVDGRIFYDEYGFDFSLGEKFRMVKVLNDSSRVVVLVFLREQGDEIVRNVRVVLRD
ncbi:Hypothetical_protein [Hexamita inflata]|uniref:Hypothetical_protein n=1 Tax=Hexamita inflata TaxID=28002 RepID=A0AA86NSR3_9EUKA|nr:Hypothetical protein HINF_LOCUS12114 [Hexamita inflata]CAI9971825.1 Hypothetical protein HINF_LOCUS59470 [Hexamita inflata]